MRSFRAMVCVCILFMLSACVSLKSNINDEINENEITPEEIEISDDAVKTEEDKTKNDEVLLNIIDDYLFPLDDYSWELEEKPEYVMLHFTSAVVTSRDDPYNIAAVRKIFEDSGVSIHYIIDRDGTVYRWLPETRAAWHAGKGTFADNDKYTNSMNKFSIGIEMLAIGSKSDMSQYLTDEEYKKLDNSLIGYTDEQYKSLSLLVKEICERNSIPFKREYVIGHNMYNPKKSDPGDLFEWDRLFKNAD